MSLTNQQIIVITPSPIDRGTQYCLRSISLFLCWQDYEKTAGPICMKFSENVRSDLIQFWVNSEKPHDGAMRSTGTEFVVL